MGRPPAYIFIVRHGNRLDAADPLWHLSSPTPYDPPLTYSGWTQSRAIGQRIAEILRENAPIEIPPTPPVNSPDASSLSTSLGLAPISAHGKKRRYKVVVHSSPFLRCVQTSVAVASGVATDPRPLLSPRPLGPLPPLKPPSRNNSMLSLHSFAQQQQPGGINKSVLRVDAFLGEWLSPGYFELITPPPSSFTMVAGAKAELLRREDYSNFVVVAHPPAHVHSQSMGQLWGASRSNTWSADIAEGEELPKSGSQVVQSPTLGDASRPSSSNVNQGWLGQASSSSASGGTSSGTSRSNRGYIAPKPHFALSGKAPVPSGYVAHARDACVNIDCQWDSMRAPHDWGDGGEFGEEWTTMHRRFRKGLQNLVDWYTTTETPTELVAQQTVTFTVKPGSKPGDTEFAIDDEPSKDDDATDDDCIEESVVVLVSHGAGCNAMIGAITQQPVLMDVGLASLTVVARKPGKDDPPARSSDLADGENGNGMDRTIKRHKAAPSATSTMDRSSSPTVHTPGGLVPLNQYYEVKLLANTEHLRSNVSSPTSAGPWSSGSAMSSVFGGAGGGTRGRHANSLSSALGNLGFGDNSAMGVRSASAGGSFHGGSSTSDQQIEAAVRRASGASRRPPPVTLVGGKGGGIAISGSVSAFSSPTSTASPLGRARTTSIGLWSPVSAATDENDEEVDDDDDVEMHLSFGSSAENDKKGAKEKRGNKTISNASTASSRSSSRSGIRNSNSSNRKSNLGTAAAAAATTTAATTTTTTTTASLYRAESASSTTTFTTSLNGREMHFTTDQVRSSSTVTTTTLTRKSGLWQTAGGADDRMGLTSSKRRWALNEPTAQL